MSERKPLPDPKKWDYCNSWDLQMIMKQRFGEDWYLAYGEDVRDIVLRATRRTIQAVRYELDAGTPRPSIDLDLITNNRRPPKGT